MLEHGQYIMALEMNEFEAKLQDCKGVKYHILVTSGTEMLLMNMTALGIQPGEEPADESGHVSRGSK